MKNEDLSSEKIANKLAECNKELSSTQLTALERKKKQEELRALFDLIERGKQEWELVADSFQHIICLLDNHGRILRANMTVEQWGLGRVRKVKGKSLHELFHYKCADPACYFDFLWAREWIAVTQGHPVEIEVKDRILNRYLRIRALRSNSSKKGAESAFAVVTVHDISEIKEAESQLQINSQILSTVNQILNLSFIDLSLEHVLENLIDIITSVPYPWISLLPKGAVFLVETDPELLILKAHKGLSSELIDECSSVPFGQCICGSAASSGKIVFSDSVDERHVKKYSGISPHGHYCIPLVSSKKVMGVITLYSEAGHKYSKEEEQFLTAAATAFIGVIERKKLEDRLKNKIKELERFHKVAVGRELKMKELKARVAELEEGLEKK